MLKDLAFLALKDQKSFNNLVTKLILRLGFELHLIILGNQSYFLFFFSLHKYDLSIYPQRHSNALISICS